MVIQVMLIKLDISILIQEELRRWWIGRMEGKLFSMIYMARQATQVHLYGNWEQVLKGFINSKLAYILDSIAKVNSLPRHI